MNRHSTRTTLILATTCILLLVSEALAPTAIGGCDSSAMAADRSAPTDVFHKVDDSRCETRPQEYLPLIVKEWKDSWAPVDELEVVVLRALMVALRSEWVDPYLETVALEPSVVSYRSVQPIMAGAAEYAEISRYGSAADAQLAFGQDGTVFHDMAARLGSESTFTSEHYQDVRWIKWLQGLRIYRVVTQYNSTYCGAARDPAGVAEALVQEAFRHGLIPLGPEPTPTPTPTCPCYPWLAVDPLPCWTESTEQTVSGTTSQGCTVIVYGGLEPVQVDTTDGDFAVAVQLHPDRAHHLEVAATWRGVNMYTYRKTDRNGRELAIWCLSGGGLAPAPTSTVEPARNK